jgi:HemY protein
MRRALLFVIGAAIVVAAAWYVAHLAGTVTFSLAGTTVTAPASLALLAVVVVVLVLVLLLRLIFWLIATPRRIGAWRSRRRRAEGDAAITRTLVAIAAGEGGSARREAARARRLLGDTPQTLLLAAEAERLAKEDDAAIALYKQLAKTPEAALLGLRGLFRQAMTREAWDEAAAIARRAEEVHPGGNWLRAERAELAVRTGNWAEALLLAPPEAPRAAYAAAAAEAETDPTEALHLAKRAWRENPGFVPAALAYARRLREAGREGKALEVIRQTWGITPQPELAEFALMPLTDPAARLREAQRLASTIPEHPESCLLLARENFIAGRLEEARRQAGLAREAGLNQRRLWLLVADIEAAERGETEEGRAAQRDALRRAAEAEPDPTWRCDACGTEQPRWLPSCPVCHTPGRIRWGTPRLALPVV